MPHLGEKQAPGAPGFGYLFPCQCIKCDPQKRRDFLLQTLSNCTYRHGNLSFLNKKPFAFVAKGLESSMAGEQGLDTAEGGRVPPS